nr:hypothetical protein [Tanacetum cinerariifolium]
MATTIDQQVALDEALIPSTKRLRIGRSFPCDCRCAKNIYAGILGDCNRSSPFNQIQNEQQKAHHQFGNI